MDPQFRDRLRNPADCMPPVVYRLDHGERPWTGACLLWLDSGRRFCQEVQLITRTPGKEDRVGVDRLFANAERASTRWQLCIWRATRNLRLGKALGRRLSELVGNHCSRQSEWTTPVNTAYETTRFRQTVKPATICPILSSGLLWCHPAPGPCNQGQSQLIGDHLERTYALDHFRGASNELGAWHVSF
jgi:hypothetical protein